MVCCKGVERDDSEVCGRVVWIPTCRYSVVRKGEGLWLAITNLYLFGKGEKKCNGSCKKILLCISNHAMPVMLIYSLL